MSSTDTMCMCVIVNFILNPDIYICGYSERTEPEPKSTEEVTLRFLFGCDKESYGWQVCWMVMKVFVLSRKEQGTIYHFSGILVEQGMIKLIRAINIC